jgi:hypothetical protein
MVVDECTTMAGFAPKGEKQLWGRVDPDATGLIVDFTNRSSQLFPVMYRLFPLHSIQCNVHFSRAAPLLFYDQKVCQDTW